MADEVPRSPRHVSSRVLATLAFGALILIGIVVATIGGRDRRQAHEITEPNDRPTGSSLAPEYRTATTSEATTETVARDDSIASSDQILALGGERPARPEAPMPKLARARNAKLPKIPGDVAPDEPYEVTLAPPLPKHQITPDQVRHVVGKNERDVATCYEGRPLTRQKLEIRIVVEPSGQVSDVVISGAQPEVSDCVGVKARAWKFPAFEGSTAQEIVVPVIVVRGRA